jgi:hypothetical protein
MADNDSSVQAAVAGLLSAETEIGRAWGREPAVRHQAGLADLVPSAGELLATPLLRPPYLLVMADGRPLATDRYCREERVITGGAAERVVDGDLIAAALRSGAGIKFNRMELWSPPLAGIAAEFGRMTGKAVKVWGFLSAQGETMFPPHRDPAHVLAVQLDGTKQWRLDGPCPDGSWNSLGDVVPDAHPVLLDLKPGDVLYLPYGFAHSAVATCGRSYHVTFALEGITAGEVRTQIVKALYDRMDRADGTEIRSENLARVLADASRTLSLLASGLGAVERCDPGTLRPENLASILGELLASTNGEPAGPSGRSPR